VLTVLGNYAAARQACLPLAELAPGLVALTAAADVASLNGSVNTSTALLHRALDGNSSASDSERIWALTILAEADERQGNVAAAEDGFKRALAIGQRDPYLMGAYADLLLDQNRAAEARELLKNENRADGLLLRLALAEAATVPQPDTLATHVADLKARFEAQHLRGDFVHQREEARFALHLLHQPPAALQLAQANWQVQHEPADVRILLEAALAANSPEAARPALEFLKTTRLEDVELAKLVKSLPGANQ
jgi:predicted Zn-dependent protease